MTRTHKNVYEILNENISRVFCRSFGNSFAKLIVKKRESVDVFANNTSTLFSWFMLVFHTFKAIWKSFVACEKFGTHVDFCNVAIKSWPWEASVKSIRCSSDAFDCTPMNHMNCRIIRSIYSTSKSIFNIANLRMSTSDSIQDLLDL